MKVFSKLFRTPKKASGAVSPQAQPEHGEISARNLDSGTDVRLLLAARLCGLFPAQTTQELARLYAFIVQFLGTYALDEVLKIRLALSTALKDYAYLPPKPIAEIVGHTEREVTEPILRFCAGLRDEDILEILSCHSEDWVMRVIKGRVYEKRLSPLMSEVETPDPQEIVSMAKECREWHEPAALRADMPVAIADGMADFITEAVADVLRSRNAFDDETISEIITVFRRRMDLLEQQKKTNVTASDRIAYILNSGGLSNETVVDGLAVRDHDFVMEALAAMSGAPMKTIEDVVAVRAPTPLVALCWKAGLSMRTALLLQQELAQVPKAKLIYPKDGTDYPFTDQSMKDQLKFLGVRV